MPRRYTAFERDLDTLMTDPEFAEGYERSRARIDAIDTFVRALDTARKHQGLTKATLARRLDMEPSVLRRLFTSPDSNPQVGTVVEIADLLGMDVVLRRRELRPVWDRIDQIHTKTGMERLLEALGEVEAKAVPADPRPVERAAARPARYATSH